MTEVELEYPRADAVELVRTAFEEAPSFASITVEGDGEKIVGAPKPSATSFGEEVVVWVPDDQEGSSTTITVEARRKIGLNLASNPWKYKSEFLAGIRDLRGESASEFKRDRGSDEGSSGDAASDAAERPKEDGTHPGEDGHRDPTDVRAATTADAWMRTARVVGAMLLGLLGLVALIVVLTVLLP